MTTELPDWPALTAYLRRTHGLVQGAGADGFGRFSLTGDGLVASVGVFRLRARLGGEWLALAVTSCRLGDVDAEALLRDNRDLAIGVLCVLQDTVIVRQTLPFDSLTSAHVDQTCREIARVAFELGAAVGGDPGQATAFDHLIG